jgi:uroporphyrinogen III methyltransferase / synthase
MNGLSGQSVLITRPRGESLAEKMAALGACPRCHPVIQIQPCDDWRKPEGFDNQLFSFDWIVFVSTHGVEHFFSALENHAPSFQLPGRIAAIGNQTAASLHQRGRNVDLVPHRQDSHGLADALCSRARDGSILLIRGDRGSTVLSEALSAAKLVFEQWVVYQTVEIKDSDPEVSHLLATGKIDWVTITSSVIAQAAVNLWGSDLKRSRLASISPTTSAKLRELGYSPTAEATVYNMDGVVRSILEHPSQR